MSVSGEPPLVVNTMRVKVLESTNYLKQRNRESPDFSKASPSNGQCPTAVSSRNQTIASREIPRPQRIGSSNTPTDYQPAGIVVIKQDQFRPLQSSHDDGTVSVGTAGDQVESIGEKHMSKQFTFKDPRPQQVSQSIILKSQPFSNNLGKADDLLRATFLNVVNSSVLFCSMIIVVSTAVWKKWSIVA